MPEQLNEQFTDRCKEAFALANEEALRRKHEFIGSGHILLGLLRQSRGRQVINDIGVDTAKLQQEVERLTSEGGEAGEQKHLAQAGVAKRVAECAIEEKRKLHHNYVGIEHVLLGLLGEPDCVAAKSFTILGFSLDQLRIAIHDYFDVNGPLFMG